MERIKNLFLTLSLISLVVCLSAVSLYAQPPAFSQTAFKGKIPYGPYYIQSAKEYGKTWKGCWDIPGHPKTFKPGQNINVWDITEQDSKSDDRKFYIRSMSNGVREIGNRLSPVSKHRVDVQGGKSKNGTNIMLWHKTGGMPQRFTFQHMGKGRWKIYTMTGKVVCLDRRSSENGSNVHIWDDHNGPWCEWVLVDVTTKRAFVPVPKVDINVSLQDACRDTRGNMGQRYFSVVDSRKVRKDSGVKSISAIINTLKPLDRIAALQKIVIAVRSNKDGSARNFVYYELNRLDYRAMKKSFAGRLQLAVVKKLIETTARQEKERLAKKHLQSIAGKI